MTREEAIKELKELRNEWNRHIYSEGIRKQISLDMAIKALEQEPCEDCISKQAVLAIAGDSCLDLDSYEDTKDFCDEINELPPVTPQPKTGHWIKPYGGNWHCDKCDHEQGRKSNFCPDCGAKMVE